MIEDQRTVHTYIYPNTQLRNENGWNAQSKIKSELRGRNSGGRVAVDREEGVERELPSGRVNGRIGVEVGVHGVEALSLLVSGVALAVAIQTPLTTNQIAVLAHALHGRSYFHLAVSVFSGPVLSSLLECCRSYMMRTIVQEPPNSKRSPPALNTNNSSSENFPLAKSSVSCFEIPQLMPLYPY